MTGKIPTVGPHSRPGPVARIDGRSRAAKIMEAARDDLITHLGGSPSAVELRLIDRAALLTLHCHLFDQRALDSGAPLSERDSRAYLAYSNSLTRLLARLGIKGAKPSPPSLGDVLAGIAAEHAA